MANFPTDQAAPQFPAPDPTPAPLNSDAQKDVTASLATVADKDNAGNLASFDQITAKNRQIIDEGQEAGLRQKISSQQAEGNNSAVKSLQLDSLKALQPDQNLTTALFGAQDQVIGSPNALETQGVQNIQNMAGQDPHTNASIQTLLGQDDGQHMDTLRDNISKTLILNREIDKLNTAIGQQGGLTNALQSGQNLVGNLLSPIPIEQMAATYGNFFSKADNKALLPGGMVQENLSYLWSNKVSPDAFEQEMPNIIARLHMATLGNPMAVKQGLEDLRNFNNADAWTANAMTVPVLGGAAHKGVQALGIMDRMALMKKATNVMDLAGNRDLSAAISAQVIQGDASTVGVKTDEALANSLPSSAVPDTGGNSKPWISNTKAIQDHLDEMNEISARVNKITQVERLTIPQQKQAIQSALDDFHANLGANNLLDTRLHNPELNEVFDATRAAESDPARTEQANTLFNQLSPKSQGEFNDLWQRQVLQPEGKTSAIQDWTKTLNPEEAAAAKGLIELNDTAKPVQVSKDFRYTITHDPESLINNIEIYVGPDSGDNGFLTPENAQADNTRKGLGGQVTQLVDGKYAIKVQHNVAENGIYDTAINADEWRRSNLLSRYIRSADHVSIDRFSGARHLAYATQNRLQKTVLDPIAQHIKSLSSGERKRVETMMNLSQDHQEFFDEARFQTEYAQAFPGKSPSIKEQKAYLSAVTLNNIEFKLRNIEEWTKAARDGVQTIDVNNPANGFASSPRNGRVIAPDFDNQRTFDLEDGTHYKAGSNTDDLQKKYATGNYHMIEFTHDLPEYDTEPVKHVLANKADVSLMPLEKNQLGRVDGFHRQYKGNIFAKQMSEGTYKDGTKYVKNPNTHAVYENYKDANDHVASLNEGLEAYRGLKQSTLSEAEARTRLEATPFGTPEKIETLVEQGRLNIDHDFEVSDDRQLPSGYSNLGNRTFIGDADMSGRTQWNVSQGRMYYSQKGEHLMAPQETQAPLLAPLKTLDRAVKNALRGRAFGNYTRMTTEEWMRAAGPYLKDMPGASNFDKFMNAKFDDNWVSHNPGLAGSMEANRQVIKRFLGIPNNLQKQYSAGLRQLQSFVDTRLSTKLSAPIRYLQDKDPLSAMTAMTYDAFQGLFKPAQFILHVQQAVIATTMAPKYGARAIADAPAFNWWLLNKNDEFLDMISKMDHHGFEAQDYKLMAKTYQNEGLNMPGSDTLALEHYSNALGSAPVLGNIREAGRMFIMAADKLNHQTAWKIAWQKVSDAYPGMNKTSSEFIGKVLHWAADYEGNMGAASKAGWNQGVLKAPTQYLSWQARMMENILPKVMGGNDRLTNTQKATMAVGHLLLSGVHGAFGIGVGMGLTDAWGALYQHATGEAMPTGLYTALSHGFYDSMVYAMSGGKLQTDFSHREGLGTAWEDLYDRLSGGHGQSFLSVLGGPSTELHTTFAGNVMQSVQKLAMLFKTEQVDMLPREVLNESWHDIVSSVSTLHDAQKAYWIWQMGQVKDQKTGLPLVDGINKWQAVPEALGMPDRREYEVWHQLDLIHDRQDQVKQWGNLVAKERLDMFAAHAKGDDDGANTQAQKIGGIMQAFRQDPDLQRDIFSHAQSLGAKTGSTWNDLVTKNYNATGQEPVGGR